MQETFYATFAGIAFTLLGLWWVVVEFRHGEWMDDPGMRRTAYTVSLYFALPGIMSLLSLVASDSAVLWRTVFLLAGLVGLIESLRTALSPQRHPSVRVRAVAWLAVLLFAVVCLVALVPATISSTLGTPALNVEAVTLGVILFLGVTTAWHLFAAPAPTPGPEEAP